MHRNKKRLNAAQKPDRKKILAPAHVAQSDAPTAIPLFNIGLNVPVASVCTTRVCVLTIRYLVHI